MFGIKEQKQTTDNFIEAMNKNFKICEGIGALKLINVISAQFKNADGSIQISGEKWLEFIKPYTEITK